MQLAYPGRFLTLMGVVTGIVFVFALQNHWWTVAWLLSPLILCHVGLFFRIRLAAWVLTVAYGVGCVLVVLAFFLKWSFSTKLTGLLWRLALNILVIRELHLWLRRDAATVRY